MVGKASLLIERVGAVNAKLAKLIDESISEEKKPSKSYVVKKIKESKKISEDNVTKEVNVEVVSNELPPDTSSNDMAPKELMKFFDLTSENLVQSFIMSEVLGKPVSKRRRLS